MTQLKFTAGDKVIRTGPTCGRCLYGAPYTIKRYAREFDMDIVVLEEHDGTYLADQFTKVTPAATPPAGGTKDGNPKEAIGSNKLRLGLVPYVFTAHTALAMTDGMGKYGAYNYEALGARSSVYIDAALRHIQRWSLGQETDPDSGVHNLGHAAACLAILLTCQQRGNLNDDRQLALPNIAEFQDFVNSETKRILEKHAAAGHSPKHYTTKDAV